MLYDLKERELKILESFYEGPEESLANLSKKLEVSVVTLRSDIESLENKGFIVRGRGGAQLSYSAKLISRMKDMHSEKNLIAKEAAKLVEDGDSIIIVAGTTSSLIPKYLYAKRDINIVTNSTLVLSYSRIYPNLKVTLVGGEFIANAEAVVGAVTLNNLDNFFVNKAFIGTDGFSVDEGITANSTELSEVVKRTLTRSSQNILVADSTKYSSMGFAKIGDLNAIDILITDNGLQKGDIKAVEECGVKTIIAKK